MTHCDRTRLALAALAFASVGIVTACSSARSLDDASPAEAAATEDGRPPSLTDSTTPDTTPALPTLPEVLVQDRFVALAVALERTGLDTVIVGLDDFVLFAPLGTAFASSGADVGIEYPNLMSDTGLLDAIMRYHVIVDPSTNQSWRTLNGAALDVSGSNPDTIDTVDGVEVLERIQVRNGTILVVPRLLLPTADTTAATTSG